MGDSMDIKALRERLQKLGFTPEWLQKADDKRVVRVIAELDRREREKAKKLADQSR